MSVVKDVWTTKGSGRNEMFSISIESSNPDVPVNASELTFPDRHTGEKRHTLVLALFDIADLKKLRSAISKTIIEHDELEEKKSRKIQKGKTSWNDAIHTLLNS